MLLPQVGESGQQRLRQATVVMVGAGGLGCPALQYLAGSGIGTIRLVDGDTVAAHNLHRQPLYGASTVGLPKVDAAAEAMHNLNAEVHIEPLCEALTPANVDALVTGADVVLDCADSFAATYTLSDVCLRRGLPYISASALALGGYAGGFCGGAPSVRALFPDLPDSLASCDTAGVLGPVVGMLGALQAQMALAVLLGLAPSPLGQLVNIDAGALRLSSFRFDQAPEPDTGNYPFIAASQVQVTDLVIELRAHSEAPEPALPQARRLAMEDIRAQSFNPEPGRRTVLCCRTGLRAWRAARALEAYADTSIALLAAPEVADQLTP
jgi:sulfur-carrier protein adenylyltransferase/sulfurtransferase